MCSASSVQGQFEEQVELPANDHFFHLEFFFFFFLGGGEGNEEFIYFSRIYTYHSMVEPLVRIVGYRQGLDTGCADLLVICYASSSLGCIGLQGM